MEQWNYVCSKIPYKVPENTFIQKLVYYESKFVTLYALSQRNWKPKTKGQALVLKSLKLIILLERLAFFMVCSSLCVYAYII